MIKTLKLIGIINFTRLKRSGFQSIYKRIFFGLFRFLLLFLIIFFLNFFDLENGQGINVFLILYFLLGFIGHFTQAIVPEFYKSLIISPINKTKLIHIILINRILQIDNFLLPFLFFFSNNIFSIQTILILVFVEIANILTAMISQLIIINGEKIFTQIIIAFSLIILFYLSVYKGLDSNFIKPQIYFHLKLGILFLWISISYTLGFSLLKKNILRIK